MINLLDKNLLKKVFILILSFSALCLSHGQDKGGFTKPSLSKNSRQNDSLRLSKKKSDKSDKAKITQYLIISQERDTTFLDTTINIKKEYKFNYLREDNFNLLRFANLGQTYNTLSYDMNSNHIVPKIGASARHFNYKEIEDVNYYEVPTPLTELFWKTAFQQGQLLESFFTTNLSKQLNFSISYKGLRSLGNYQRSLTSTGNFTFTTNFKTKNNRYNVRAHIVTQDLLNQESGGISDADVINFQSGDEEFIDRSVFDPQLADSENIVVGKRYYIDQEYFLINKKDSTSLNQLSLKNTFNYETKFYQFNQNTLESDFFGSAFTNAAFDRVRLKTLNTSFGLGYRNKTLGNFDFNIQYTDLNYGYDNVVVLTTGRIPNRIQSSFIGVSGNYKKEFNNFSLKGAFSRNLSNEFKGTNLNGQIAYQLNDDINLSGQLNINSSLPNFNYLLYQSDYINYNWYNFEDFETVNTQTLSFVVNSPKYANAVIDLSNIDNFTYFGLQDDGLGNDVVKPFQSSETLQYLRVKINKEFKFLRNFRLNNTVMYQTVTGNDGVLNVPNFITRNTLYYKNEFFKKNLKLETGVTLKYFTKYFANGYDPLLAEFYTQNTTEIGGFPMLDFFINAKVRQTRIYLKAEHFNSAFTGYDYFSAPNYPYRDFVVRFGLVWNFFL